MTKSSQTGHLISNSAVWAFYHYIMPCNGDYIVRIYFIELEIQNTTDTASSASYLDLHADIGSDGQLRNKILGYKR